jgi:hypothetical protein
LKSKLASSVRQTRYQADVSSNVRNEKESVVKKARSSSKNARDASLDKTVKRYDGSDDTAVPAWYKVLKKNLQ